MLDFVGSAVKFALPILWIVWAGFGFSIFTSINRSSGGEFKREDTSYIDWVLKIGVPVTIWGVLGYLLLRASWAVYITNIFLTTRSAG